MAEFRLKDIPSQHGRIAVVTGANSGLGFETARAFAAKGMKVIMACRNMEKAQAAKSIILKEHPGSDIEIMQADLSRFSSVRKFARLFMFSHSRLDLLVNNAGIMIPPYSKTEDGFESQMGINYFAHFLLTGLLFEPISKTPGSRIITLASNAHKRARIRFDDLNWERWYSPLQAYGQSKLACLVFAFELQRRIRNAGLKTLSLAAHPGLSVTELVRNIPKWLMFIGKPLTAITTHSPEKGALPVVYAALAGNVKGGEYYGPQGYNEWTGHPGKAKATLLSQDEGLARKLWEVSEELTGVTFP